MTLRELFPNFAEYAIGNLLDADKDINDPKLTPEEVGIRVSLRMTRLCSSLNLFVETVTRKEYESVFLAMRIYLYELIAALQELQVATADLVMKRTTELATLRQAYEKLIGIIKRENAFPTTGTPHPDVD